MTRTALRPGQLSATLFPVRHPERPARDKAGPATWADIPRCLLPALIIYMVKRRGRCGEGKQISRRKQMSTAEPI